MKKDEVLQLLEQKGDADYVVRTADEEATFLANHAKKVEDEIIPEKISKLHSQYDDDIYSVVGMRKGSAEKTYDFLKRVLSSFKTDAEKASQLEGEMLSLKEQIKKGSGDKQLIADLDSVRKAYDDLKTSKESEVSKLKKEHEEFKAESIIRSAVPTKIKKNLPEEAVAALVDQAVNSLKSKAQFQDNKLVFLEDGVVKRNPHNKLEPYTAGELLGEILKNIIDPGRKTEGGPDLSKEVNIEKDKDGKITKVAMIVPDSVKTKEQLSDFLVQSGLLRGTEEYYAAYREYSAGLPMR